MKKAPNTDQRDGAYGEQLSFLPTPEFSAISPEIGTLQYRALIAMAIEPISQINWLSNGCGWRLSATVNALNNKGWEVLSERRKVNGTSIAIYSLSDKSKKMLPLLLKKEEI